MTEARKAGGAGRHAYRQIAAAVLAGMACASVSHLAVAGNLTRCDQARLAAHDAITDAYRGVMAELDERIARAEADRVDLAAYPYRDKSGRSRSVNITALRDDLQRQLGKDAGGTDRKIARDCGDETPENAAKAAQATATLGLSTVLTVHMPNSNWPGNVFGSAP